MTITFEIGLDEAGYGPVLGPLVIGAVRVDGPAESLLRAIESSNGRFPAADDSKKVMRGPGGLRRLEIIALSAWTVARGRRPRTVRDYFDRGLPRASEHPWYGAFDDALPVWASASEVESAANGLSLATEAQGAALSVASPHVRFEGGLNAQFGAGANKASAHLDNIADAMTDALTAAPSVGGDGRITCDRLGGRRAYSAFLSSVFPFRSVDVLREVSEESRYAVDADGRRLDVRFLVRGDSRSKETSLASCLAKYGREVLMRAFNRTFTSAYAGLAPTAGYPEDAARFLADLARLAPAEDWRTRLARRR